MKESGMKIDINGYASVSAEVKTLGDLREFMAQLDKWRIRDESEIDWGYDGRVFVEVADTASGDAMEPIMCGDHLPTKDANGEWIDHTDFVITAHRCVEREPIDYSKKVKYDGPETYEEALEEALDRAELERQSRLDELYERVATFDWVTRDRLERERSQICEDSDYPILADD